MIKTLAAISEHLDSIPSLLDDIQTIARLLLAVLIPVRESRKIAKLCNLLGKEGA